MVQVIEGDVVNSELLDAFVYNYIKCTVNKSLSKKFKSLVSSFSQPEDSQVFDHIKTHIINYEVPARIQCHKCSEFGHLSHSCPTKKKKVNKATSDNNDDTSSVKRKSSPKDKVQCYKCKEFGHLSFSCPQTSSSTNSSFVNYDKVRSTKGMKCYYCSEFGHVSNDCPQVECYKCHEFGHFSSKCPNRSEATGSNSVPLGVRKTTPTES